MTHMAAIFAAWSAAVAQAQTPAITVSGDFKTDNDDVRKVLISVAEVYLKSAGDRRLAPILVSPTKEAPITLHRKGPNGETRIKLACDDTYWSQYAYQFAHELCHVLSNCDRRDPDDPNRNQWFEEALCETASLFVLRRMTDAWKTNPPYRNYRDYAPSFQRYADSILARRDRRLPPDLTMAQWLARNIGELEKEDGLTPRSKLAATYLLSLFEDQPDGWEALAWINLGENDRTIPLGDYLAGWKQRVPEKHKAFVGRVAELFGAAGR